MKKKEPLSSVDQVFEKHKKANQRAYFKRSKRRLFLAAMGCGFLLIFTFYLASDQSKIKGIRIVGNRWLSDEEIMTLTGINDQSRSLFLFESLIQRSALQHPLIESIKIQERGTGIVDIEVVEKQLVGYRYLSVPELVTSEGDLIEMTDEMFSLITQLPLIVGFSDEPVINLETEEVTPSLLAQLAKALKAVDPAKISLISEIHQYAYSYDQNGILCIMQDGNEVYGSLYSIDMLNDYNRVASALPQKKNCIYIDEMSGNPYTSLCPEELMQQEEEEAKNEEDSENQDKNPSN